MVLGGTGQYLVGLISRRRYLLYLVLLCQLSTGWFMMLLGQYEAELFDLKMITRARPVSLKPPIQHLLCNCIGALKGAWGACTRGLFFWRLNNSIFDAKVFRHIHSQRNVDLFDESQPGWGGVVVAEAKTSRVWDEHHGDRLQLHHHPYSRLSKSKLWQHSPLDWYRQLVDDGFTHLQVGVILLDYIIFTLPGLIVLEVDLNAERNENVGFFFLK